MPENGMVACRPAVRGTLAQKGSWVVGRDRRGPTPPDLSSLSPLSLLGQPLSSPCAARKRERER